MKILAVGAHLDDIEIACGGTLAKAIENGHRVRRLDDSRDRVLCALPEKIRKSIRKAEGNVRTKNH